MRKTKKGEDVAGNGIPPEWQSVIDKSAADIEAMLTKARTTGITAGLVVENGITYVLEPLDAEALARDGVELATLFDGLARMKDDRKKVNSAFKDRISVLEERLTKLAEEIKQGARKRPAQKELEI